MNNGKETLQTPVTAEELAQEITSLASGLAGSHTIYYSGKEIPPMIISGSYYEQKPSVEISFDFRLKNDSFKFSRDGVEKVTRVGRTVGDEYVVDEIFRGEPTHIDLIQVRSRLKRLKEELASGTALGQPVRYEE